MYILIWQSVTWRPGKSGFLVEVKPRSYPVGHDCRAPDPPQENRAAAAVTPPVGLRPPGGVKAAASLILIDADSHPDCRAAEDALVDRPLSLGLIRAAHQRLMQGVRGRDKEPGAFRTDQNWIGRHGDPIERARFVPPSPLVLQGALENWEHFLQAEGEDHRRNEHAHFRNYICRDPNFKGSKMGRQIKPFDKGIGHLPIAKIMPSTVIRFRDNLFASGLSHTAVRAHIISLHLALEHARLRDYVPFNAADKIKVETPRKEKEKRVTPPSPAAIKEVLAIAPEEFCFIIEFSACTGLRAGELRPLRYKHIDFEKRVVKVKVALDVDDIEGPPKSKAGYREIPLSATLLDRLRARKEAAGAGRMSLVFPNEKSRYIYRGALLRELNRLTAALGWIKPGEINLDVDEDGPHAQPSSTARPSLRCGPICAQRSQPSPNPPTQAACALSRSR